MTMLLNRCCHCGCTPVNFKQFDFSDGTLNWEALLYSPMLATNGDVYSIAYGAEFLAVDYSSSFTGTAKSITLPTRLVAFDNEWTREYSIAQRDSAGTVRGDSGLFNTVTMGLVADKPLSQTTVQLTNGMDVAGRRVNDDGHLSFGGGVPKLNIVITNPTTTETEITYYLHFIKCDKGDMTLTMDSHGTPDANSDCDFDIYDSAATVKTAIETAFGTNVTTVTVTGDSVGTTGLKVVIDWDDNQHYMKTYEIASSTRLGCVYTRSLQDAELKHYYNNTLYSSSYLGTGVWQDNGALFRLAADVLDATNKTVESLSVAATPTPAAMTLTWTNNPLSGKQPINPEEPDPMQFIEFAAGGGIVAVSFPRTAAFSDPGVRRMSVISWDDDGTNREEYHNTGNHWTGDLPYGLCMEDGSDDLSCFAVEWRDDLIVTAYGDPAYATETYGASAGDPCKRWASGSGSTLSDEICTGDFMSRHHSGFDNTSCAFCDIHEARIDDTPGGTGPNYLDVGTAGTNQLIGKHASEPGASGIYDSFLNEIYWYIFTYHALSYPNALSDEYTQWRLRWVSGSDVEQMIWMQETETLAGLNAELLSVFGVDANGGQNVVATVATDASPISVPIYKRGLSIECHGATDASASDEADLETPPIFTIPGTDGTTGYANMPELYIDIEHYTFNPAKENTFGAINWATGTTTWSRNFNASGVGVQVADCMLHDGNLHVLSRYSGCGES